MDLDFGGSDWKRGSIPRGLEAFHAKRHLMVDVVVDHDIHQGHFDKRKRKDSTGAAGKPVPRIEDRSSSYIANEEPAISLVVKEIFAFGGKTGRGKGERSRSLIGHRRIVLLARMIIHCHPALIPTGMRSQHRRPTTFLGIFAVLKADHR
ncbi:hypothetical protein ATY76_14395 [Rhizobium sp. R339]|uniref:hypothetical protein n=1 Tax=Rhizobium sp. R339 TaxID=1764273 RepID=UPI000B531B55|nr:hypothetical protein [Rhizobium sp. R339]OWV68092.1 hypothetical protein ATY76_14395 [Rhizobium sp. R339]